ncbi:virion structural protein [Pseudomonas phage Phabio]|uniref:Virion structural protein n=1 Tax=Pseudomonas phage Phabio TaxID=2006668 RepID=A0A1Y0STG5_9CAUD|nr:internal head protein [Pseudomonas phage Phabio]ARV76771.1 virion structural protein [Pseudomonas phage Phabio]
MTDDTRQDPSNRPSINDGSPEQDMSENIVFDNEKELESLIVDRIAVEKFYNHVVTAGTDGLDDVARKALQIGLNHINPAEYKVAVEDFTDINISAEDIGETLKAIGKKIMAFIETLIEKAKVYAAKIMSGVNGVISDAEELLERAKQKPGSKEEKFDSRAYAKDRMKADISNELYGDKTITINNPGILMNGKEFCADDCSSETEIVKFFQGAWPQYAIDQIKRARKMIGEYDVESGNSENFKANSEFLGNHASLVAKIVDLTLPGNKKVAFKYVALGPELVDVEDAPEPPAKYTMDVRDSTTITKTLKDNIEHMRNLSKLLEEEAKVLHEMKQLSQGVQELEGRRGETIFKGARDDLDSISSMVMGLVNRLKPNLDPIVRHLARVGVARNAVCRQELDARG